MTIDGPPDDIHGDGKLDENVITNFTSETPVIRLSSAPRIHSISDSFEFVTFTAS